jgi:hypothetical protein
LQPIKNLVNQKELQQTRKTSRTVIHVNLLQAFEFNMKYVCQRKGLQASVMKGDNEKQDSYDKITRA